MTTTILTLSSIGQTAQLAASVTDQSGAILGSAVVVWASSAPSVASVSSSGLVTALAEGTAQITASSGAAFGTALVTVAQVAGSVTVSPESIVLAGPGDTATVSASAFDVGGSEIANPALTWSSSRPDVATVNSAGVVAAVGSGSAELTVGVSRGGQTVIGDVSVTVEDAARVDPAGGDVSLEDEAVSLEIPAGALSESMFINADPATGLPPEPTPVPGTAFDFGPDGTVFGQPVRLTISYDPAALPPDALQEDFRLYKLVEGAFVLVDGSTVDVASNTVSGMIDGFSVFAVLQKLSITTTSLPDAVEGVPYSESLTATGASESYAWQVWAGTLPTGLTLDASTGSLTGSPETPGTSNFTVEATSSGLTDRRPLSITVHSALEVTSTSLPDGVEGSPYTASLEAMGGVGDYSWSVVAGSLPPGLVLSSEGIVTGTPTTSGTVDFTAEVTSGSQTAHETLSISVLSTLQVTTETLAPGVIGAPYSHAVSAVGGDGGYAWSLLAGALPAGLDLEGPTGLISGTPTEMGTASFTIQVASGAQAAQQELSITVNTTLHVTTTSLPNGAPAVPYSESLAATGGGGGYTWVLLAGSLPIGLSLTTGGAIAGTPTTGGTSNFIVQVTSADSQTAQKALSITVTDGLVVFTTALPEAIENVTYGPEILVATGSDGNYSWSVASGQLPPGLALSVSGEITGTPTSPGTSNFTVEVTSAGQSAQKPLAIEVVPELGISTASLPDGVQGHPYSETLTASGGDGSYTWTLASGSLPPGLTLSPTGNIGGTPGSQGTSNFTVRVSSGVQTAQRALSIRVPGGPATVTDLTVIGQAQSSLTVRFTEVDNGLGAPADYAIRHAFSPIEWGEVVGTEFVEFGTQIGSQLEVTVTGLLPGTQHDVQLVAFRGTLNVDAIFSDLSNIATGTTVGVPVLRPTDHCSDFPDHAIATFEDEGLESAVRRALGVGAEDDLTCALVSGLATLGHNHFIDERPSDLTGLQNLTGLETLVLDLTFISDLGPLGGLSGLATLHLGTGVHITDISPLGGLTGLIDLDLYQIQVDDFSPLAGLTSLEILRLGNTTISDFNPLGGLTSLTTIAAYDGNVTDISALSGLVNLTNVVLFSNPFLIDVQGLIDNPGFGTGDRVSFGDTSVGCADVAALEAKGVDVNHDCLAIAPTSLPDGEVNVPYSQALTANFIGPSEASWGLASGSGPVPPGLTLSASGELTGAPTVAGTSDFTVEATDIWLRTAQQALSITVQGQPATAPATVTDLTIVGQTPTTITVQFTEVDDGMGAPAHYDVRHAPAPIAWGAAAGSSIVLPGAELGASRQVTISGLDWPTPYDIQLVAYRGTLGVDAVFSNLSNIATGTVESPPLNLSIVGVHLNQGNQSLEGLAGGVADRAGLLRVVVGANVGNVASPDVRVRLFDGGTLMREEVLASPGVGVPLAPSLDDLSDTWNLQLAATEVIPGLGVQVLVDPNGTVPNEDPSDNTYPETGGVASLDVQALPPLDVVLIPVQGTGGALPDVSPGDVDAYLDRTWKWIPTGSILTTIHAPFSTSEDLTTDAGWSRLLSDIQALRTVEGATDEYYHGLIGRLPVSPRWGGLAYVPGSPSGGSRSALTYDSGGGRTSEIMAHELGHNLGRWHAPCGGPAGVDPSYPYPDAVIGVPGYDIVADILKPSSMRDYMSYCGPTWTSDYTYGAIRAWRLSDPLAGAPAAVVAAAKPRPTDGLLLWGRIDAEGVTLNPAFNLEAVPALPQMGGENSLRGYAADGSQVFSFTFQGVEVADSPDPNEQHFAFFVPLDAARIDSVDRITVTTPRATAAVNSRPSASPAVAAPAAARPDVALTPLGGGQVRLQWDAARYPMAMIRDRVTGQVLSFARGGETRVTVGASGQDRWQVLVSDGVKTSSWEPR